MPVTFDTDPSTSLSASLFARAGNGRGGSPLLGFSYFGQQGAAGGSPLGGHLGGRLSTLGARGGVSSFAGIVNPTAHADAHAAVTRSHGLTGGGLYGARMATSAHDAIHVGTGLPGSLGPTAGWAAGQSALFATQAAKTADQAAALVPGTQVVSRADVGLATTQRLATGAAQIQPTPPAVIPRSANCPTRRPSIRFWEMSVPRRAAWTGITRSRPRFRRRV